MSINNNDIHNDQNYSNLTKEQFELSESISNWTEAQRAELTFHLLTTLPPYQVTQIVDRISPYIYRNILCASLCLEYIN
ncbi:hypothetical protein RMCBS344292_05129 [Rhizopus microsporus]|nr:hypothetical protein RMCBS344292_05129 [Rhizopus microsporus]